MKLFSFFKRKKKEVPVKKTIKSTDEYKNSVSFTDYNDEKVYVSVRTYENVPYLFIGNNKNDFEFAFDKDSAALLSILLSDYTISGSLSNVENTLEKETSNGKR